MQILAFSALLDVRFYIIHIAGHCCLGLLRGHSSTFYYNKHNRTEFNINWFSQLIVSYGGCEEKSLSDYCENKWYEQKKVLFKIRIWRTLGVAMLLCEEVQFGWRFSVLQGFGGTEVLRVFAPPFPLSPCRCAVNVGQPTDLFWKYAPPLASKKRM